MEGTITARFDIDGRIAWLIPVVFGIVLIIANGLAAFTYLQQLHRAVAQADHSLQVTLVLKEIEDLSEACGWSQRNDLCPAMRRTLTATVTRGWNFPRSSSG